MRMRTRLLSLLLAGALLLPALPAAQAEEASVTGSISGAIRLDYPQSLETLRDRELQVTLVQNGRDIASLDLTREVTNMALAGYPASVSLRNRDGGSLGSGSWPGCLDFTISGVPQGSYSLRFTGEGFKTYTQNVRLNQYAQHITLGTGDATFSLGDLDGDGRVDSRDRDLLSGALGSTDRRDLERYDLSGDGVIDIYDLAYLSHNINAAGDAEIRDTVLLAPPVDSDGLWDFLTRNGITVTGDPADLFRDNGRTVTFTAAGNGLLAFTIPLTEPVEMEEIQIISPDGPGAMEAGTVSLTYSDNSTEEIPFDITAPTGLYAIGPVEGSSVVTIPLGRKVAVKSITITVTRTAGGDYAVVESIQFLKDIVPENPTPLNSEIKNLTATPGDGKVSLRWSELPNVSGYRVDYRLESGGTWKSLQVDVPRAEIAGLENLKTYVFTVTPVDGAWTGKTSAEVSATPQPAKAPAAPDMVSVGALDSALSVSWKAVNTATYYEVYYQAGDESGFRQWGGQLSGASTVITGLTNGVTYSIYVKAGNAVGVSGPSRTALGTPTGVDYSRPAGIPTEGVVDYRDIQQVWLADSGNVSPSAYTASNPFQAGNMADGDFSTHWTSQSYDDGNWGRSKQVYASFQEPVDLSSVIWVPRLDGGYASNLRVYTVTVWQQGDNLNGPGTLVAPDPDAGGSAGNVSTWLAVRNNPAVTKFAVLPFEPVTDVVKIAITIEQVAYTAVSLSELMFLEYDPAHCLPDNITDLFADELHTALKPGVTQGDIDALRQRLNSDEKNYYLNLEALADELDLAEELLQGQSSGVLVNGLHSRSSAADSKQYSQGGSDLQPLGAAAKAGEEITVYASGIPAGETVTVYASQYNAEASAWLAQMGTLRNGRNVLTVPKTGSQNTPRGGSLYVTYSGSSPSGIRLHVRRAVDIPALELSDWYAMTDSARRAAIGAYASELAAYVQAQGITDANRATNCLNVTEISMPSVLLSIPAAAVLNSIGSNSASQIETLYNNVLAWEDLMHICKTTQGIDKTYGQSDMTSRQNIRCMQMFSGAFMYAAGSHVGIGYGSCGGMVCGKPLSSLGAGATANSLFGWGIAHEIGHNMDKLGKAEITNNLYSLMVQTADTGSFTLTSRLEAGGKYPAIFTKTAQSYPGDSNDVFVQLGLYWQLHLAYDGGENPMDFYNRFFKAWKAGTYFGGETAYGDRVARTASAVADRNLTEFFTRWGMTLSDGTKEALAAYPAESRALWYLSDQSRRERLAGKTPASGSVSTSAALTGDNEITLTITPQISGTLQGYEIRRSSDGGKTFQSIGFTTETTYKDVIGSANHRTYAYEAVAYDILGNAVGSPEASNEVRVAYDKTVPDSGYTMARDGETVTITLNEETAVSGLKLTGAARPASGGFTVAITDGEGKTTTARSGDFSQDNQAVDDKDSYIRYFQKPGAPETDTRIWTYDAKTVVITGIPESLPDSGIQLISYAGDDVAFLETGSVGVLAEAYRYGTGAGETIPAGTLIITGTYRGDPLYQTVRVEGRFVSTVLGGSGEEFTTTEETRPLDGQVLLFAEIPDDGAVSDISDGLFIFIPNTQREAELQGEESHCAAVNLLPTQLRAVLSRTDLPESAASQRVTAETLWINSPGGTDLPAIELKEGT